jgi:hypothetical protein
MAEECYYEPGRTVETMTEDGDDGEATLHESRSPTSRAFTGSGTTSRPGKYKVIADVTEATATRRDKTVKQMRRWPTSLQIRSRRRISGRSQAAIITATLNMDGEGLTDFQKWNRKRASSWAWSSPTRKRSEMEQAQQQPDQQQPDPAVDRRRGQGEIFRRQPAERKADTCSSSLRLTPWADPKRLPLSPMGWRRRTRSRTSARKPPRPSISARRPLTCPNSSTSKAHNAVTNRIKALADRAKKAFKGG